MKLTWIAALITASVALGCAGGGGSYYSARSRPPMAAGEAQSPSARSHDGAPSSSYEEARPGLGTGWGENRVSYSSTVPFARESYDQPWASGTVWYNDDDGVRAMTRGAGYDRSYRDYALFNGMISVSLSDGSGRPYPAVWAGGRQYIVGEPGERYVIVINNRSGFRFECVASVDGLDVIDGEAASYGKRGYVINPYGTLEIDGFRRSEDTVAAFRFSSVRGSYSAQSGQGDRNVGVIGLALFQERGTYPTWSDREVERRHQADPFPQQYARPPY